MKTASESPLSKLALRIAHFLLRLYLLPLKKLLCMQRPSQSLLGRLRHSLKIQLTGNAELLGHLLDPQLSMLHDALQDKRTNVLNNLLSAENFLLLNAYLNAPEKPAQQALDAHFAPESSALRALMLDEGAIRLKTLLTPESDTLETVMLADNAIRLKALLVPESHALTTIMFADNALRLKSILTERKHYRNALKALKESLPPGTLLLYDLMADDTASRLKAVMTMKEFALARKSLGVRSEILEAVLKNDDQKVLRVYLFDNEYERLAPLLDCDNGKAYRHLLLMENSPLLRVLATAGEGKLLHQVLFQQGLMHYIAPLPLARAWCDYDRQWESLCPWANHRDPSLPERLRENRDQVTGKRNVHECLLNVLYYDGALHLFNGELQFTERYALYTLIQEILVNNDYFADFDTSRPRIIDCGAHQGMSLYYFKTIFPDARITAFEPDPENRAIAEQNMTHFDFSDVEILPYALAGEEHTQTFHIQRGHSMAGSLTDRREHMPDAPEAVDTIEVTCVRLSSYLQEDVDYLKIDVEGVEDEVLAEAAKDLHRVKYLFCEYHHGLGLANDRLIRILQLLEDCNFDTQVTKAYNFQQRTQYKPMDHVGRYYSSIIFAKRRVSVEAAGTQHDTEGV